MREVLDDLLRWWQSGESVGVTTVVATFGSAPYLPGAVMLVGPGGEAVGSVSGGCVEAEVYALSQSVVESGGPVLQRYGISDDDAFAVGLTCGGFLDVYVEKVNQQTFPELGEIAGAIKAGRPVASATVIEHPAREWLGRRLIVWPDGVVGSCGSAGADALVTDDANRLLASGRSASLAYGPNDGRPGEGIRVFVRVFTPIPRMLVFGAIDFAAAVARIGRFLGYRVTVCDARPVFATDTRFPDADEVIVEWPHTYLKAETDAGRVDGRTAICVLTHDPKFDVPVLDLALRLPTVAYVGAMGSRRTHEERMCRLREAGLPPDALARLSSPVGLDLGARTPEETAVSIAAEIIASRCRATGERLSKTEGPIHAHAHTSAETLKSFP